jgi:catechol 2,3-dioxygenase-like lactoylglutathione lyase family enzyme
MTGILGSAELIAFIGSADVARSRSFYEGTLGLELLEENEYACVFSAHGTMLRVAAVPEVLKAGYTVLGWDVPDIRASIRALKAGGVSFHRFDETGMKQDEDDVWAAPNGDLVAWFTDPDEHVLSLTQFMRAER